MSVPLNLILLAGTSIYQAIACWLEDRDRPPGELINIGDNNLHLYAVGNGDKTIIIDHSLGGVEGYLLADRLTEFGKVYIYDRAGYGWSKIGWQPRTSQQIVNELESLLKIANIAPPYILIGNSFGSYNMRLYAFQNPEKVTGLILTDGLHEAGMLRMSLSLLLLKGVFISGFVMSVFGSVLGIIRLLNVCGVFELIKPELRHCKPQALKRVKRSFCRPKHWVAMAVELWYIQASGKQVSTADNLGDLPIANIKANSFFRPSIWTKFIPLARANALREEMHVNLMNLSTNCDLISTVDSSHFVWVDEPDAIAKAVQTILVKPPRS